MRKKENEFCKIFEVSEGQVLLTKNYDAEEEQNVLELTTCIEGCRMTTTIAGFERNNSNMDEAFDKYNAANAEKLYKTMKNLIG